VLPWYLWGERPRSCAGRGGKGAIAWEEIHIGWEDNDTTVEEPWCRVPKALTGQEKKNKAMAHLTVDIGGRPGVDCRGFCEYCYFKHVRETAPSAAGTARRTGRGAITAAGASASITAGSGAFARSGRMCWHGSRTSPTR